MRKKHKPDANPLHDRKLIIIAGGVALICILFFVLTGA
jgi:hypothetical protein